VRHMLTTLSGAAPSGKLEDVPDVSDEAAKTPDVGEESAVNGSAEQVADEHDSANQTGPR
jgi:hypothetical protein